MANRDSSFPPHFAFFRIMSPQRSYRMYKLLVWTSVKSHSPAHLPFLFLRFFLCLIFSGETETERNVTRSMLRARLLSLACSPAHSLNICWALLRSLSRARALFFSCSLSIMLFGSRTCARSCSVDLALALSLSLCHLLSLSLSDLVSPSNSTALSPCAYAPPSSSVALFRCLFFSLSKTPQPQKNRIPAHTVSTHVLKFALF